MTIAIIGQGYVGLPLSLQFARSGVKVIGLDIDPAKVDAINSGRSYIKHISGKDISEQIQAGRFSASTDFSHIRDVEAAIICVPTPLNKNREPDISYIIETGRAIAPFLKAEGRRQKAEVGEQSSVISHPSSVTPPLSSISHLPFTNSEPPSPNSNLLSSVSSPSTINHQLSTIPKLVVLESTTYPGTTDEDLRAVVEEGSGLKAGVGFHLAFSPEREDPGNPQSVVATIPKVVGGYTPACLERAVALYSKALKTIVPVSSCRVAEATKILENTFRSINIALVNELKVVYSAMNIDVWEVIAAAKTKPFGFMPFYPGPGLGGHCIPIDPFYLTWKAREYGQLTKFIELAGEVNTAMPMYVVNRLAEALNSQKKAINGSKILLVGLAYKPNVDDDRESPSYVLMDLLTHRGAEVDYYDPYVPVIKLTREHPQFAGRKSINYQPSTINSFDALLIATNHASINYQQLADSGKLIIDTRNAMANCKTAPGQVWKA